LAPRSTTRQLVGRRPLRQARTALQPARRASVSRGWMNRGSSAASRTKLPDRRHDPKRHAHRAQWSDTEAPADTGRPVWTTLHHGRQYLIEDTMAGATPARFDLDYIGR